jgi:hypothetical protein
MELKTSPYCVGSRLAQETKNRRRDTHDTLIKTTLHNGLLHALRRLSTILIFWPPSSIKVDTNQTEHRGHSPGRRTTSKNLGAAEKENIITFPVFNK